MTQIKKATSPTAVLTISKQMAIMSHLSDCQEMVDMYGDKERIRMRINFVKAILCDGKSNDYEYTNKELDTIWQETKEQCGILQ